MLHDIVTAIWNASLTDILKTLAVFAAPVVTVAATVWLASRASDVSK